MAGARFDRGAPHPFTYLLAAPPARDLGDCPGRRHGFFAMTTESIVPATFEAALSELEAIVTAMEGGQMPLQESLVAYKRGAELLRYCQSTLKDAEQQVQIFERGLLKAFEAPDADPAPSDES